MIVICTGISGVGKREYLGRLHSAHSGRLRWLDVGETMLEVAAKLNIQTSTERILDLPQTSQTALRSTVFEQFLKEISENAQQKDFIISLHASFRWKDVFTPGFNAYYLKRISRLAGEKSLKVLYVCFTDTAPKILARLQQREQWKDKLTLEEVILWSNEEAVLTKMIAEYEDAQFFLIPTEEPVESLWGIMSDSSKKKLYLSFPITHVKNQPEVLEEVYRFRDDLRESFVVFDPLAVKDIEWIIGDSQLPPELAPFLVGGLSLPSERAKRYMESQTVARDFQFVDQSDFVVVYYKSSRVSFGVISEMIHGHSNNKPVYAVWDEKTSPFFTNVCTSWLPTTGELLEFLRKKYGTPNSTLPQVPRG